MGMGLIMKKNKYVIVLVLLILIVPFNLFLVNNVSATWYNEDWDYYRTITIDSDFVGSELTNFPILVSISDEIGDKCKANGEDIVFVLPDNTTVLNHEIEKWVDNDERLVWVNVTTITHDTDTVFLMYYGNTDASDSQNPNDVWDSNFIAVYHMDSVEDSTIYDKDLVNSGADLDTNGKIGSCYNFVKGNSDVMVNSSLYDISTLSGMTIEMLVNPDSEISTQTGIIIGTDWYDDSLALAWSSSHKSYVIVCHDASNRRYWRSSDSYPDDGSWYQLVGTYTADTVHVWVNGTIDEDVNYDDGSITWGNLNDDQLRIGQIPATEYYDGHIDEVRISNIVRTDAWIEVTFHSQNQTNGFSIIGSEQSQPPEPPTQSNEYPFDGSTDIELTPSLHVLCLDTDSESLYATWWSNSSGAWVQFASNWTGFASDTTIIQTNENFTELITTYFWSVNLTDGSLWNNETYHFTTRFDWLYNQSLAWLIRNITGVTIFKLLMSGGLDITGSLRVQSSSFLGNTVTGNFMHISETGFLTLYGNAKIYKEIIVGSTNIHKGSSSPDDGYVNAIVHTLDFDKTTTQHGHYNTLIPMDILEGTNITIGVDWFFDDVEVGHYITWEVEYLLLSDGDDPNTIPTTIYQKSIISTGNNDKQLHTTFGSFITGATADDTLLLRFSRDSDATYDTDDLNQDARLLVIHLHYISDKLGEPV